MSALDQLRERINKRVAELRKERKKKKGNEKELQKVREEVFKTIRAIYIEPLASRAPPAFRESNESFGESRNVE